MLSLQTDHLAASKISKISIRNSFLVNELVYLIHLQQVVIQVRPLADYVRFSESSTYVGITELEIFFARLIYDSATKNYTLVRLRCD